ncbi:hypothetical protein D3C87_279770 [compost metagenome]
MILADFSFNNPQIKEYFNGSDAYIPTSEFMYIHTHPLVKPNFVDHLESMINRTAILVEKRSIRGAVIDKFTDLAIKLGAELPNVTKETAPVVLSHLREIYKLCKSLLKSD